MSKQNVEENKTTFIKTWGQKGSSNGEFSHPHGIAVGHDGTIYISDTNNHRIQHFDSNGNFLFKWGQEGDGDDEFRYPSGLGIEIFGESIMLAMLSVPELSSYPWRPLKDSLSGILSICLAYVGTECLYVVDHWNHRIQVFEMNDSDNVRFIRKWGSKGSDDGQFEYPWSCAIDPHDGMIYVTDAANARIQVFDSEGKFIRKWGSFGNGDYQFNYPRGICVSDDGLIYIADKYNDRIVCYSKDGSFVGQFASGMLSYPTYVMVDGGMVDVVDGGVRQFRKDGSLIKQWGSFGSGDGQFNDPHAIAKGSVDTLYVTDTWNHRVVVIKL